jgi:hypothetical protein
MRELTRAAALVVLVAGGATACNAILGISDVPTPVADGGDDALVTSTIGDAAGPADARADATMGLEADTGPSSDAGAPPDDGGGCETQGDTHNCGQCGHDCLGGKCMAGVCQPVELYPADGGVGTQPWALTQDDTYLYWTDLANNTVRRTSKTTGATIGLLPSSFTSLLADAVSVDDAGLYWGDTSGIWRCPKTGCTTTPVGVAGGNGVYSIAIDDVSVYWSQNTSQILVAHKFGTGETASVLWQGDASANRVATDGQRVYFTADDGLLHGVPVDGGPGFSISSSPGSASGSPSDGVTLNGGNVYWTILDQAQGQVLGASTSGLSPFPIAVQQQYPNAVATDGTNIYWTGNTSAGVGQISECALAQCTATVIATASSPFAIVVDDVAIYWTDTSAGGGTNGAIFKLAK